MAFIALLIIFKKFNAQNTSAPEAPEALKIFKVSSTHHSSL
jgi:hypothetical protein